MAHLTWTYLTETATRSYNSWTNKQIRDFHAFNPNGAKARWDAMTDTVGQYVDAGTVKNGWLLVHGSLNFYNTDQLRKYHDQKRIDTIALRVTIEMINEDTEQGYIKLGELHLEGLS